MAKLFKSFSRVLLIVLIIKILDIIKSLILASRLGVSDMSDIFMAIMLIPDGLIVLLGLDSIKGVLNSEYSKIYVIEKRDYLWKSFSNLFLILSIVSLTLNIFIFFFREEIISLFLPGFDDAKKNIAISLSLVIFPVFIFKIMSGTIHSVLNSIKKFNFPIAVNVVTTIALIISVFLPYANNSILYNLSFAILISNILIFIFSYLYLYRLGGHLTFSAFTFDETTKNIFRNCLKIIFLVIFDQLFNFSKNFFASFQGVGAISSLSYAKSIPNLVITLIFTTIFSILLSNLSSSFVTDKRSQTKKLFIDTINTVFFICVPIVIIFLLDGEIILRLFYLRGNFDLSGINKTVKPFYWETLSILSFVIFMLPTALYLAKKQYKDLNLIGSFIYLSGIFLNYFLSNYFGYVGLSIANFLVTLIYGVVLLYNSQKFFGKYLREFRSILLLCVSALLTIIISYLLTQLYNFENTNFNILTLNLFVTSLIVLTVYFAICKLLKVNYLSTIKNYF